MGGGGGGEGISTLQKMGGIMSTYSKMGRGDLSGRDFVRPPFSIDGSDRSLRWNKLNFYVYKFYSDT